MVLSHFERRAKTLHNPKRLVCKDSKKYKINLTHSRMTSTKVFLKLGISLRKKVTYFELKLKRVKIPIFKSVTFFSCGF